MPQFKNGRTEPADAANAFVRVILTIAGDLLSEEGHFTKAEWEKTRKFFNDRCAYTGDDGKLEVDHAIPMNRDYCGLHLYGNLVPAMRGANSGKRGKTYAEYLGDDTPENRNRKERIDQFMHESGYAEKAAKLGDLRKYCESQYDAIRSLSGVSKRYLESLLPSPENENPSDSKNSNGKNVTYSNGDTLQITLDPESPKEFKDAFLKNRNAYITVHYMDGRQETSRWQATRILPSSNIIGNLRSRPQFRQKEWQKRRIAKVAVSIQKPQDAD